MKTIRHFFNIAEAGFAQSLLESVGIQAFLADEQVVANTGWQHAPRGVRLQVAEADEEKALRILDEQEGFAPLPDDFVPPEEEERH